MNLRTLLTCNLTNKTLTDGTANWTPPTLTYGESMTLALRFEQDADGAAVSVSPNVTALQAALGNVDARPLGGSFALQIGAGASQGTTAALPWNVGAVSLQMAINALSAVTGTYGQAAVVGVDGSLLIRFPSYSQQAPIQMANNLLWPVSFGRLTAWEANGQWTQELRLTQAPLAFTSASGAVLPPAPSVTEVQQGGSSGGTTWNEIQSLYVPPDFLGTYYLKMGNARTSLLDVSDGPAEILAALSALGDGFKVTNPAQYTANIEFIDTFGGAAQALLQAIVESAPMGDLTFTLDLGKGEMAAALRNNASISVPLQVTLTVTDGEGNASEIILYVPAVTIQQSLIFPELAEVPGIDWLMPPSPVDYVPFDPSQVITGQQFYAAAIGDGSATSFAIAHGLATESVFVWVRENHDAGRQLVPGTDYTVTINSANQVTVAAVASAPAANAWVATVVSAQTVAAFASGLRVTIGQVTGLQDALDAMGTQIAAITALLPTAPPSVPASTSSTAISITLPNAANLLPGRVPAANAGVSPTGKLPRPGALLPCVNTLASAIAGGTFPLGAASANAGAIYQNLTGSAVEMSGGLGFDSFVLLPNQYVASDGRRWYRVFQNGSTNSFYPGDFEQTLFRVDFNDAMLTAGSTLTLNFNLLLQLLQANTRAQYVLVIETGDPAEDASPAATGANLSNIDWNTAAPMLSQRIILTETGVTHSFGVSVARDKTGTVLTAQRALYGVWTGGATAPSEANFALRARLIQFDTEDSVAGAKGTVYYAVSNGTAQIVR